MKHIYTLCFLFLSSALAFAQLAPFTISLEARPETCKRNGELIITTHGLTEGTSTVFSVYKMPDQTNAVVTTTATTIDGLDAGSYKVKAVQSGVNYSNQATADATIKDEKIEVIYDIEHIEPETCGNDGGFTINVSSGTAPYIYQILDAQNNVISTQDSPEFTGLKAGKYKIRVNDACGVGRVKEVDINSVENPTGYLTMLTYQDNCLRNLQIVLYGNPDYSAYSYELSYVDPNTGETITLSNNRNSFFINAFSNKTVTFNYKVINKCGVVLSGQSTITFKNLDRDINTYQNLIGSSSCGKSYGFLIDTEPIAQGSQSKISDIIFTEVPAGVDAAGIDTSLGADVAIGSENNPLVAGTYKGTLITCAGQEILFVYNYQESTDTNNSLVAGDTNIWYSACGIKSQSFEFRGNVNIASVTPINPPAGSDYGLYIYNSFVEIYVYNYPPGDYEFEITNICGFTQTVTITVVPQEDFSSGEVNVEYVCGGFNIKESKKPYNPDLYSRYLQIYDENLGGWTTPKTDITRELYQESDLSRLNFIPSKAYYLNKANKDNPNLSLEENFEFNGKFRVLERSRYFKYNKSGSREYFYCAQVINEFEVKDKTIDIDAYGFSCSDGKYTVAINGKYGIEPFTYQIVANPDSTTEDNIIVNNDQDHLFVNLTPGNYYFRAIDACGNFNTVEYSIADLGVPKIIKSANCETKELSLKMAGLEYLNFQWYKEGAPNNILSTSSILDLGNVSVEEAGQYFVHITSQKTGSCINEVLGVTVNPNPFDAPNAGQDFTVGPIVVSNPTRLLELVENNNATVSLNGSFDFIFGDGQNAQNSGTLSNNVWYPATANEGVYRFKYTVNGLCGEVDEAIITIINRNVCVKSPSTSPSTGHPPVGISTLNRGDATRGWLNSYNDGWIALESRTKGLVITRADDPNHPENTINNPVGGMLVFDIDENCLKLYDGTKWGCIYRGCDDDNSSAP